MSKLLSKLLYVIASPRGEQSESRAIADQFLHSHLPGWLMVSIRCLSTHGTLWFHIGTVKR
jgi:hypothetical protein